MNKHCDRAVNYKFQIIIQLKQKLNIAVVKIYIYFFATAPVAQGLLVHVVSRSHTTARHSR
jgi:hypothetical protein